MESDQNCMPKERDCICWQAERAGVLDDKDFIRLEAEKAEFERAKERLTLKHKNTSQWARRALKRGVNLKDDGELAQTLAVSHKPLNQCQPPRIYSITPFYSIPGLFGTDMAVIPPF